MNAGRTRGEALSSRVPALGARFRRLARTVILAVAVWVSALPFALLLVVPRVGIGLTITISIGLLAGIFLVVVAAGGLRESSVHGDGLAGWSGDADGAGRPQEGRHRQCGFGYRTGAGPGGPLPGGADHEYRPRAA